MEKKKCVISMSGGLDSTSLACYMLSQGYEVRAYAFDYGQKHIVELERLQKNIEFFQSKQLPITLQIINVRDVFSDSNSSLKASNDMEIPKGDYGEANMKSTVVENRNVIFSSIIYGKALGWANKTNSHVNITLGIHGGDHALYPDTTRESFEAAEYLFKISNWNSERVDYVAPFVEIPKNEVLAHGLTSMKDMGFNEEEIKEVLKNTISCYSPNEKGESCGRCGTCKERLEAFKACGIEDPIAYAKE